MMTMMATTPDGACDGNDAEQILQQRQRQMVPMTVTMVDGNYKGRRQ